jgi:hypothetical protein
MRKSIGLFGLFLLVSFLFSATVGWASPFSQAKIIIEINASAGDGGIQISVDGVGWNRLEVFDPDGQRSSTSVAAAASA